ncbi:MAG TPA: alginate lyase family protein [Noviherbaspirillum sp.]|nr:alginate lyase family protein [Noviherbaspirillum sp.]
MPSLGWMFNRLRLMGPAEVAWRSRKALAARFERARAAIAPPTPPAPTARDVFGKPWLGGIPDFPAFDAAPYCAAAERILAGRYDVFALRDLALGFPPEWNRDPKTGVLAPLTFGKTLDYRDERTVGDIKYLWEINRHYEIVTLAQAWRLSEDDRFAEGCRRMIDSWIEDCPYPLGANWSSALEHALRLVNWAAAWQLLGGAEAPLFQGAQGAAFRQRWLAAVHRHCDFIASHLSKYSSANNHLFGEYMGMFIASLTWPCWAESSRWRDTARQGLEAEALKQIADDGVNLEQAIWYHHEVTEMMLLCTLSARRNDVHFARAWWARLEAMCEFIAAVMDVDGNVPMIGDADDAVMLRLAPDRTQNVYRSLLATAAVLFSRPDFARKAGTFDDKSRWLLGQDAAFDFAALKADGARQPRGSGEPPPRLAFPHGGYYVLGSALDTPEEVRIVADAGPLGYLSIAAHGHADALSFTLSAAGREILIDPGTCAYHTQPAWRAYFRGTSAHNTVRIDGRDQSEAGGNFMWLHKAHAQCELWDSDEDADRFAAWHDGYQRLPDPVIHRRKLLYMKSERVLVVQDSFECASSHGLEFWWHFAEDCIVNVHGGMIEARCGPVRMTMERDTPPESLELVSGAEQPQAGWISRRFDERHPTTSVVLRERISGSASRITTLRIDIEQ